MTNLSEFTFLSSDGKTQLHGMLWEPEGVAVRAVLQICHGVAEHIARYDGFARALNEQGIVVAGHDHLGHGKSLPEGGTPVYFGQGNTWNTVVDDIYVLHQRLKQRYPDVPLCIMGHSMGSFLARSYAARHGDDIDAFVFCGTAGHNPVMPIAKLIANAEIKRTGGNVPSKKLDLLAFGAYNKPFEQRTTFDWLSANQANVDRYIADPLCGFTFTAAAFRDLFTGLSEVSRKDWAANVPNRPILVIAGDKDPVGSMGKGPTEVAGRLLNSGHDVILKLYPGMRHEILNETGKKKVWQDVLDFLNAQIG